MPADVAVRKTQSAKPRRACCVVIGALIIAVWLAPCAQPAGSIRDFYVSADGNDSGNGSRARPWRTIRYAAAKVRPGATVHVAPGTYAGSLVTSVSGAAEARIRFVSDRRWAARIVGDTGGEAAWKNRGDFVDIAGFDISGPVANGIENLGSFAAIIGNRVHDMAVPCDENGGAGINNANYAAHDNDVSQNLVFGVRPSGPCPKHHGVGIYHSNARGRISNNMVFGSGSVGIQLWHAADGVVVANNTVFNNGVIGIILGAGDEPQGARNDHSLAINNISVNNGSVGIQEFGSVGAHNRVSNNLAYRNPSGNLQIISAATSATIAQDPRFLHYTGDASGDYHLSPGSPAIAAGICEGDPPRDFDGAVVPAGRACDVGAYQSAAKPVPWPWR